MGDTTIAGEPRRTTTRPPVYTKWSKDFLAHLALTSNVTASAKHAGIATSTAYEAKRTKPEFNRAWRQALCEGYELLEMELLHRLRAGQEKGPDGKTPTHIYDNPISFRLLVAHRGEAAKQRGAGQRRRGCDPRLDRCETRPHA